jgi:hypothetical protein
MLFNVPDKYAKIMLEEGKEGSNYKIVDGTVYGRSSSVWFTNIDHGRRHQPLPLMTMADNLRFSRHKELRGKKNYDKYDNYNAIEVPFTNAIPADYGGIMGVPISFLDKYCPEQFEILGDTRYHDGQDFADDISFINGKQLYRRILIKQNKNFLSLASGGK